MRSNRPLYTSLAAVAFLLITAPGAGAQDDTAEIRLELARLRAEVQQLRAEVDALRGDRRAVVPVALRTALDVHPPFGVAAAQAPDAGSSQPSLALLQTQVAELAQVKVESTSKMLVKVFGTIHTNAFLNSANANWLLALVYLAAAQATGRAELADVARETLDYLDRDMSAPGGGFHTATDADSEGEEGRFFTWTEAEIRQTLDPAHAEVVIARYGVGGPGRSVLHLARPTGDLGVAEERARQLLAEALPALRAARARRVPPQTDTKVVTAWNGLAISAFARVGAALAEPRWVERARVAAAFVLDRLRVDGRLRRSLSGGAAHADAVLDDYAFLAAGLVDLYEATADPRWLREAVALHETLARDFGDAGHGGFFLTAADREAPLVRRKPDADGALPSGNAVAALTLLRLAELTGDDRWRVQADGVLRALGADAAGAPALLAALDFRLDRPKEVVLVRPPGDPGARLLAVVHGAYLPNRVLAVVTEGTDQTEHAATVPLVADKRALGGAPTAYVCEQRVCARPTSEPDELARQLARVTPLPDS